MSLKSMIIKSCMFLGLAGFSALAYAFPPALTIDNQTNEYSTSRLNGGQCSSELIYPIIVDPLSSKTISGFLVGAACLGHSNDCVAELYPSKDCSGQAMGVVHYDEYKGTISSVITNPKYRLISPAGSHTFTLQYTN